MDLTNLAQLKTYLKLAKVKPNKILGQHFLIDKLVLEKIIESAQLTKDTEVLEIGPGIGTLTLELAKRAKKVVAVEKDQRLIKILESYGNKNVEITNCDFLQFDLSIFNQYQVVANLPYSITSKTIQKLLTSQNKPTKITLLIQKEVADRIVAKPGKMSVLAFSVQYFAKPEITSIVRASSFWPMPKVDSATINIQTLNNPVFFADQKKLFRLVKAGFSEKRKKLQNSLSASLQIDKKFIAKALLDIGIAENARAQELSMDNWHKLYLSFINQKIL
jgi:16S rRNA (adenine1518-N6/adenine1519-N6)-dimethyltransferase